MYQYLISPSERPSRGSPTRFQLGRTLLGLAGGITFTLICLFAISGPVSANTALDITRTQLVRTHDLDLSLAADRSTLQSRLKIAARVVCRSDPDDAADLQVELNCLRLVRQHKMRIKRSN